MKRENIRLKRILTCFVVTAIFIFGISACGSLHIESGDATDKAYNDNGETGSSDSDAYNLLNDDGICNIYFLDVGQGSCTLVECDDEYMIIDGGNSDTSSFVVSYMKNMNINEFKYLIATHYDSDHISGLIGVMNVFDVESVMAPDYVTDTKCYHSFINMADSKGYDIVSPEVGATYSLGSAHFTVIAPNSDDYSEENDYSIALKFEYGDNSFIVAGDATAVSESEMVYSSTDISADIYVVNHHGSKYSSTEEFIDAVAPEYAVISVGADNSYGHPAQQILSRLESKNIEILRTDEMGTIIFSFDGDNISWTCSNSSYSTSNSDGNNLTYEDEYAYVLNGNSKKIHKSDCRAVEDMAEKNKIYYSGTLEEAVNKGYEKCKICFDE